MKTEAKKNGLVCANCDGGNLTLCLDFEDASATVAYRCEDCSEEHLVCKIYRNAFEPNGLGGLHIAGGQKCNH